MTARLPRNRLRLTAEDMIPGEHSWVRAYDLHIHADGRVWLKKSCNLVLQQGPGPWPEHQRNGDFLVERTEEGLRLHVFKDDLFATTNYPPDFEDMLAFESIVLHIPEHEVCSSCQGRGWRT